MDKQATSGVSNSTMNAPLIGDVNSRRFMTAVLAGVLGGAGVGSAASLLRGFFDMRRRKKEDTDDETIVLTLPEKAASDGYTSMAEARPGEHKLTANGSRQARDSGKYGKSLSASDRKAEKPEVKCADEGNPGPNTVGTVVANTLGLAAGGLLSYEVVSRLYDRLNERRLKRKLEAAQQAYVSALSGASKRAEAVARVLDPVGHVICGGTKQAGILPERVVDTVRYPAAAYILALLAGTGATAYVFKKVLDREFPEEKLKKDFNRPSRIVFRTSGTPALLEGAEGEEKAASAETCAAVTAMLPIYMDVVEGAPNRTLSEPYRKIAEAAGTDAAGLMKLAQQDSWAAQKVVMKDPKALWALLKGGLGSMDFSRQNMVNILRQTRPDTYARAVDAGISATFANSPVRRFLATAATRLGGRDWLVDRAIKKASPEFSVGYILGSLKKNPDGTTAASDEESLPERKVLSEARRALKSRRRVEVGAADPKAQAYIEKNKEAISRLLGRLNARGVI